MIPDDVPPELRDWPAAVGSGVAAFLIRSGWVRKLGYFVAGYFLGIILAPLVQDIMGQTIRVATLIAALFGLSVVENALEGIARFDFGLALRELWTAALKWLRGGRSR